MEELERIVSDLEGIEERLNDLSMQILSEAIEAGASERPHLEKKISQARRTVAKARAQLTTSSSD